MGTSGQTMLRCGSPPRTDSCCCKTNQKLAGFKNDASACYNRIVMNLVGAVFQCTGVGNGPLRLQEQNLLRVRHYLKTGFGTSTSSSYTSDALYRIYGVGQGSKARPITWAAISSLLFEAQDILGAGVSFRNPTHTLAHHHNSDGMVDDTMGYHGLPTQNGSANDLASTLSLKV
jgi:hypothetical protein